MAHYLYAKNATQTRDKVTPAFLEDADVYNSFDEMKIGVAGATVWTQPITKRGGRVNKAALDLPDTIYVVYKNTHLLTFDAHFT